MPVYNRKAHIAPTRKNHPCDGCGRIIPSHSLVMHWTIWIKGHCRRVRLCTDCQEVIYGCEHRKENIPLNCKDDFMVREACEGCDYFPFCEKVEYLRKQEPGEIWFGDVNGIGIHADG